MFLKYIGAFKFYKQSLQINVKKASVRRKFGSTEHDVISRSDIAPCSSRGMEFSRILGLGGENFHEVKIRSPKWHSMNSKNSRITDI